MHVHKCVVKYKRGDLVETQPATAGGFDHRRYHWQGAHFVVVRKWHTA